jgi:hypothetical protein
MAVLSMLLILFGFLLFIGIWLDTKTPKFIELTADELIVPAALFKDRVKRRPVRDINQVTGKYDGVSGKLTYLSVTFHTAKPVAFVVSQFESEQVLMDFLDALPVDFLPETAGS